jgi:peptide/nickel transport system substrate-binding protein
MFAGSWAGDLDTMLTGLGWPINATTGWNTKMDEAIDHAVESDATTVWFNLAMPYEPFLQIVAQNWGSIMNQAWCVWHNDWPGMQVGDSWADYHDPATSPLLDTNPKSPGPHLDCALGTGPYMLDYWNHGAGNAWSIIKNPNYWEGWTVPFAHQGWSGSTIAGHVDRYTSNYIPEWSTRRLRFLGGVVDFCDVPRMFKDQVLGQPGVKCDFPLPNLAADGCFFSYGVAPTSTHLGTTTPNGTFSQFGAPRNMFEDANLRLGMIHMFDYTTYLYAAFLDEAVAPVTPIIPGITYYDPTVGLKEDPSIAQKKKYGISFEAPGQLAYDLALAKTYLMAAWGGALWANGFTIDAVYNEGNLARQMAAQLMKDAFDYMNANFGTKFTIKLVSIPWSVYKLEWRARNLPYFIVGWLADYPDAHNFAHPFMHSAGAFSKWQGVLGYNSFPNAAVDSLIAKGIGTVVPAERQGNYTLLQQYYADNAPGLIISQTAGRHFERTWVAGWYYNPIYPGNYVYDLWKAIAVVLQDVDVAVTDVVCPQKIEVNFPVPDNEMIEPFPSPVEITVARLDNNLAVPALQVIVAFSLIDASGREVVLDVDLATLVIGGTYTAYFYSFLQDSDAPIYPGVYNCTARVLVISGFANDINVVNNVYNCPNPVVASYLMGDVNCDGTVDMADISICIDAFMSAPTSPNWDLTCDLNEDGSVDMADISMMIDAFMTSFDP